MMNFHKIIKYCALAFAFFLIFGILSGIMYLTIFIGNIFYDDNNITDKLEEININSDAKIIEIDINSSHLTIKTGDFLKAMTNNKDIVIREEDNKLFIEEEDDNWFSFGNDDSNLVIYIPDDLILEEAAINTGAGKIEIDKLSTKKLYLDLGAGNVIIHNLEVLDEAEIDGGTGKVEIKDGIIHNLNLDMGVGKLVFTSYLIGNSDISAGVGSISLNLMGNKDEYNITVDKGIGSVKMEGTEIRSNTHYGNGSNLIQIDGGIGSIDIDFKGGFYE